MGALYHRWSRWRAGASARRPGLEHRETLARRGAGSNIRSCYRHGVVGRDHPGTLAKGHDDSWCRPQPDHRRGATRPTAPSVQHTGGRHHGGIVPRSPYQGSAALRDPATDRRSNRNRPRAHLQVRMGLAVRPTIRDQDGLFRTVVQLEERLCSCARRGRSVSPAHRRSRSRQTAASQFSSGARSS